jgi:hypothetical protein
MDGENSLQNIRKIYLIQNGMKPKMGGPPNKDFG